MDLNERNELIKKLLKDGATVSDVASITGLSKMRIYQIKSDYVAKKKQKVEIVVPPPNFFKVQQTQHTKTDEESLSMPLYDDIGASAEVKNSPRVVQDGEDEGDEPLYDLGKVRVTTRSNYHTSDIHLAASLYTLGYPLLSVGESPTRSSWKEFIFRREDGIEQHAELYRLGTLQLSARDLIKRIGVFLRVSLEVDSL